jgi:MraZ protein
MLFAGSHQLTVDDKGRIAIPARYRVQLSEQCGSQLVVTMAHEACLEIYPRPEFERIATDIDAMDNREHAEILKRAFVGRSVEADIDRQGRVGLPPILRRLAKLESAVVLVGQINRFELWAEDRWNEMYGDGPNSILPALKDAFRNLKR